MKIKIVSDGTAPNTKVLNAETGEEIEDIINLEVSVDSFNVSAAFLVSNPQLSMTNVKAQEVQTSDGAIQYDGGTGFTDD